MGQSWGPIPHPGMAVSDQLGACCPDEQWASLGVWEDRKLSHQASYLLILFPCFPQAVNARNVKGGNINWAKSEEVGDAILFHTSLSKFVHKCSIFTLELKHVLFISDVLQPGITVDSRKFVSKHPIRPFTRTLLFPMEVSGNHFELNNQTKSSGV